MLVVEAAAGVDGGRCGSRGILNEGGSSGCGGDDDSGVSARR